MQLRISRTPEVQDLLKPKPLRSKPHSRAVLDSTKLNLTGVHERQPSRSTSIIKWSRMRRYVWHILNSQRNIIQKLSRPQPTDRKIERNQPQNKIDKSDRKCF